MIHVLATIELAVDARDAFLAAFHALMPLVHAEDGCIEYGPAVDLKTSLGAQIPLRPNVVTVVEKWRDLPALEAHIGAPHMLAYRENVKKLVLGTKLQVLEPA
ncbi:MAG: antibiotic biosynthesis monooxygenase [Planctomycetia bacterium]|nr:antibiotic biosynthesis monooxygenase [Planctomycetia bacterium]